MGMAVAKSGRTAAGKAPEACAAAGEPPGAYAAAWGLNKSFVDLLPNLRSVKTAEAGIYKSFVDLLPNLRSARTAEAGVYKSFVDLLPDLKSVRTAEAGVYKSVAGLPSDLKSVRTAEAGVYTCRRCMALTFNKSAAAGRGDITYAFFMTSMPRYFRSTSGTLTEPSGS